MTYPNLYSLLTLSTIKNAKLPISSLSIMSQISFTWNVDTFGARNYLTLPMCGKTALKEFCTWTKKWRVITQWQKMSCCYSNVTSKRVLPSPDDSIYVSPCQIFENDVTVTSEFISVQCKVFYKTEPVYEKTHATFPVKTNPISNAKVAKYSVMILGIDSVARLNFIRTMKNTYKTLQNNNWIEFRAFNKIGDNTLPNIMAFMSGLNINQSLEQCKPFDIGGFDNCPFIWKDFHRAGYITAMTEDEAMISTLKGFYNEPTTYYFRPLLLATQLLTPMKMDSLNYCVGDETYGEKIMNLARDFLAVLANKPSFSLWWMNSFSHHNINGPGMMDGKVAEFIQHLDEATDNTFVIFLSDHGMRHGEIRHSPVGWMEERLPFLFVKVPKTFQVEYPQKFNNLVGNADRLTSHFDIYATLQDILSLSAAGNPVKALGCPSCRSLFDEIASERTCEEAGIPLKWCTCFGYNDQGVTLQLKKNVHLLMLAEVRKKVRPYRKTCAYFSGAHMLSVSMSRPNEWHKDFFILAVMETTPKIVFEATIRYVPDEGMYLEGPVTRLSSYGSTVDCVEDPKLKNYCFCI